MADSHTLPEQSAPSTEPAAPPSFRKRLQRFMLVLAVIGFAVAGWILWGNRNAFLALCGFPVDDRVSGQRAAGRFNGFDLDNATIPQDEVRFGGPSKDGIPSLSNPQFVKAAEASFLEPDDRVIGVVIGQTARAYPLKILDFHEAVNDRIGRVPFAVTYCPLCDSAAVFDRRGEDGEREFGISGLLYNSNVLFFDRRRQAADESLWSQMKTQSVAGPRVKQTLAAMPLELTTWNDWSSRHPKTQVLSDDTGHGNDYSKSPYRRYFSGPRLMFPVQPVSDRLPAKSRVLGVWVDQSFRAYPVREFEHGGQDRQLEQQIAGREFTLAYSAGANSLRITKSDDGLSWMYAFWFAWYAFHPETEVFELDQGTE